MTRELKILLDRATDRPLPFSPDPNKLIAAGRSRARRRRIVGSVATLAAVAVVAAGAAVAVDLQDPQSVAPASRSAGKPADILCTTSTGHSLRDGEIKGWVEVISVKDRNGAAWILRKPDNTVYSYCVNGARGVPNVPLGGRGGVLVRKTPINAKSSLVTVFGVVRTSTVRVVVQTGDGVSDDANLKQQFYIYRHVEPYPWPGPLPTVLAKALDANGSITSLGRW
jgi:hypothetical protein